MPARFVRIPREVARRAMSSSSFSACGPTSRVTSLDHLVLTVRSIPASVAFYTRHLGMTHETFRSGATERHALKFGHQKINLHQAGKEFEPKAGRVQTGSGDLCFLTTNDNINDVLARFKEAGVEVLEGGEVVDRTGAKSNLSSLYVRDPDGNLVEIANEVKSVD